MKEFSGLKAQLCAVFTLLSFLTGSNINPPKVGMYPISGVEVDHAPAAGDLAFIGFNADGDDGFAIVVLSELDGSSTDIEIHFTDNTWDGSDFSTGEGDMLWTISSVIAAGTVVTFTDVGGSEAVSVGTVSVTGSMNLSAENENLFAFTGSLASPTTFLAAFSTDGDVGFSTLSGTGLTLGLNAIDFDGGVGKDGQSTTDDDILEYDGSRDNQVAFEDYLTQINTVSNWISQDGSGDQSGDGTEPDIAFDTSAFTEKPIPASAEVVLTVFLEGAYNGTDLNTTLNANIPLNQPYSINGHSGGLAASIPANAVDWVLVELREASSAANAINATKVGSAAGFLMKDGSIKASDGISNLTITLSGNTGADFFVVIYHRNHLPIMSASEISESIGTYSLDFTSSAANTHQTSTALAVLSGSKFGMPSGDADGDGDVDADDLTSWRNQNGGTFTYNTLNADFNLDGVINAIDRNLFWKSNSDSGKTSQVPSS